MHPPVAPTAPRSILKAPPVELTYEDKARAMFREYVFVATLALMLIVTLLHPGALAGIFAVPEPPAPEPPAMFRVNAIERFIARFVGSA